MDESELREVFDHTPVNRLLGLRFVSRSPKEAVLLVPAQEALIQMEGVVQGGILTALADMAAVYVLFPDLAPERSLTSIECKMNFLSPALPGGPDILARARPVKTGRSIALCEVDVLQGNRLVARGSFTYLLFARGEKIRPRGPGP